MTFFPNCAHVQISSSISFFTSIQYTIYLDLLDLESFFTMASANIPLPEQGEAASPTYPFLHDNGDGSYTYRSDAPADIWSFLDAIGDDPQLALRVTVLQLTLEYDGAVDSGILDYVDDEAVLMNTTPQTEEVHHLLT
jgi:hypothetical protein